MRAIAKRVKSEQALAYTDDRTENKEKLSIALKVTDIMRDQATKNHALYVIVVFN